MKSNPAPPNPILFRPAEAIGLIQGQVPDSINEWNVSLALDKLQLEYFYQFALGGGRSVRGGQVIDFLVQSGGWIPVFVNGAYWHSARNDLELPLRLAAARQHFNREPVVLEEEPTSTKEKAMAAVRKALL